MLLSSDTETILLLAGLYFTPHTYKKLSKYTLKNTQESILDRCVHEMYEYTVLLLIPKLSRFYQNYLKQNAFHPVRTPHLIPKKRVRKESQQHLRVD